MQKKKLSIVIIALLLVFAIGFCSALVINTLAPHFMGVWTNKEANTVLQVTSMQHKVLGNDKVRTAITVNNPSLSAISFNMTVTYMGSAHELFSYVVTDTLTAGQTKTYTNTNSFDLTPWDDTVIQIDATA